jgi:tripartite-type tricarboxylate transporter receptor subunit TctC
MISRREFCAAAVAGAAGAAWAQGYPTKPVQMLVPQAPGGTNDAVARILAQKLAERLGQSVVVDNRPGAGGNIGTVLAAQAPKDGYTLLLTISSTQAINPWLYKKTGFDPVKDFTPVAPVGVVPNVLVVHPSFPAKSMREFVEAARVQKPPYQYASAGNGSLNHLLGAMLNQAAGLQLGHVPYKGVAPALNDVLGGQIPMAFASLPSCIQHIKAGKLRALGVSSRKRSPFAPDIPAIGETLPGFAGELWVGMFVGAGTPEPVVRKLAQEIDAAVASPEILEKFATLGVEKLAGGPEALASMLKTDLALWKPIVAASGASID